MAGKRSATSDLNHDNWDREDDPEDAGTFQKASDDSLKQRVIRTARRRNPISSVRDGNSDSEKKSAFTSFTGFGKPSTPTTAAFSFLSNLNTTQTTPKVNGVEGKTEKAKEEVSKEDTTKNVEKTTTSNSNSDYYSKLKGLNESVSKWIKKHVDSNPLINLQPIFRDYEKYFEQLEKEKLLKPPDVVKDDKKEAPAFKSSIVPDSTTEKSQSDQSAVKKSSESDNVQKFSFGVTPATTTPSNTTGTFTFGVGSKEPQKSTPSFTFGTNTVKSTETTTSEPSKSTPSFVFGIQPPKSTPFSFSSTTTPISTPAVTSEPTKITNSPITFGVPSSTAAKDATTSSFTFGSSSGQTGTSSSSMFTFGTPPTTSAFSGSSFSFGNSAKPVSVDKEEEEEAEVPPSNEFTPVVEKDHVYTVRCKVFVKKDGTFGDRGVGCLYLKPVPDTEKVQLVVRADTNLGNVLLNFILSESIPTKRLGNKDVMLVCVPVPELKPPPVPVLIRVKSSEEADKLLEVLEKHKK